MLRRILLAVTILVAVALAVLALWLPRLVQRPEVRERIVSAARDATGRELHYQSLGVGLLPPRLEMVAPRLDDPGGEAPLGADRVALRIAWLPLLARKIVVERVDVEGPEITVVRTDAGFTLPLRPPEPATPEPPSETPRPAAEKGGGFDLLVRRVHVAGARVTLEDRTLDPVARLRLDQAELQVDVRSLAGDLGFRIDGLLAGAPFSGSGDRGADGALDLELQIDGLTLAALQPWVGGDPLAGVLDLQLKGRGTAQRVERLEVEARLADADLAMGDVRIRGPVPLQAELSGPPQQLGGPISLDLTQATLAVEESFRKTPGVPARLRGKLVQEAGSRRLEDLSLELHTLRARGRAVIEPTPELTLDADPLSLEGWQQLIPALGDRVPGGTLALRGLRVRTSPLRLHGALELGALSVPLEQGESAVLSGVLYGEGDALEGKGLELRVADQPFRLGLRLDGLASSPHFTLRLETDAADSQRLLAALAGREDTLSGPLRLRSQLRGPLLGEQPLLERLTGRVSFEIAPGRLRGVSFLKSTFDVLGKTGTAVLAAGELAGGEKVERFYEDRFERLGGTLAIAAGRARTDDLRLDYRDYRVELRGSIGLADRSLDLTGRLTIFESVDRALAQGSPEAAVRQEPPVKRVIPLAAVRGTVDSPRITVTRRAALGFGAAYVADPRRRAKWERKLDERLGEGAGREVLGILDAILSGEKPSDEPPPPGAPE